MKTITKLFLFTLVVSGLQFGLAGCVGEVGVDGGYHGGGWYHDGPWVDGGGWGRGGRVDVDIHPPGRR
jgi:hypothetical protein